MKTLICGDYSVSENNEYTLSMPKEFVEKIDESIKQADELLIGSKNWGSEKYLQDFLWERRYRIITVYVSGSKRSRHYNCGKWTEKYYPVNGKTALAKRLEKDFGMVEDADRGFILWQEGNARLNTENLIIILGLAALGKPCKVFNKTKSQWIEINSISDVYPLVKDPIVSDEWKAEALSECGMTDEMIMYLASDGRMNLYEMLCIINNAPIPISRKSYLYSRVIEKRDIGHVLIESVRKETENGSLFREIKKTIRTITDWNQDNSAWTDCWKLSRENMEAKNALTQCNSLGDIETVFYLFDMWYDTDVFLEKKYECGMFLSFNDVMRYIRNEEKAEEEDYDEKDRSEWESGGSWYLLELWEHNCKAGNMELKYQYYIYAGEVCWFDEMKPRMDEETGNIYYYEKGLFRDKDEMDCSYSRERALGSIETPYKTGDIVRVDCRPFGPPFNALILEARDQYDDVFPTIVFRIPYTDDWSLAPLKAKRFYKTAEGSYEPRLSPLYRLNSVTDDKLSGEDETILKLRDMVSGSEEKASKVWDLWKAEKYSKNEMLKIFSTVSEA